MTAHPAQVESRRSSRRRRLIIGFAVSLGVVLLGSGLALAYVAHAYAAAVPAHVSVAGIELGGLSELVARTKLQAAIDAANVHPITFTFTVGETTISRTPAELGVDYDAAATVAEALGVGQSDRRLVTVWHQLTRLFSEPLALPIQVSFDRVALVSAIDELTSTLGTPTTDAKLSYSRSGLTVSEAKAGQAVDVAPLATELERQLATLTLPRQLTANLSARAPSVSTTDANELLPRLRRLIPSTPVTLTIENGPTTMVDAATLASWVAFAPVTGDGESGNRLFTARRADAQPGSVAATVDHDALASYLKTLASVIDQPAVDAKLTIRDGRATVFQASRDGRTLTQDQAVTVITTALTRHAQTIQAEGLTDELAQRLPLVIELPFETTTATITDSTVSSLGINQLIGTGTTDFSDSPTNRVHNISNGVKYLSGWLVKPGDTFSTVGSLGAIDDKTGYLPELVIVNNKTFPEFGGGLCQVSTTLFRAVLNAGLPVTARTNHSYRVSYYERGVGPGLDATIYSPSPDLTFRNDSPGWILIQGSVDGTTLTFELYGTSDGRVSQIDGPYTLTETSPPPDEIQRDDSLPAGEKKQLQFSHPGATTTATYTVTRAGQEVHRQVFNSSYKAMPAIWAEGPPKES